MNQEDYGWMVQDLAKSGQKILESLDSQKVDLMHAVIGVSGEAGELLDQVKKHVIYNKPLDVDNIIEELGDMEFYMEMIRRNLWLTREQCLKQNYDKLMKKRYPNGYSDEAAHARADKETEPVVVRLPVIEPPIDYVCDGRGIYTGPSKEGMSFSDRFKKEVLGD